MQKPTFGLESLKMLYSSKLFWCILGLILAVIVSLSSSQEENENVQNGDLSSTVPILMIFNEYLDFIKSYLNTSCLALIKINDISFEEFGEDTYQQQTVYLRSYYSNEPIQAVHTEKTYVQFLNVTSLQLLLLNYENNKQFTIDLQLAHTAEDRYAAISFLSSSHLPSLQSNDNNQDFEFKMVNNIRVLTMNLWNYNYWIQRLELIDDILFKYKPDIIGLQEVRIRSRYLVSNLYPDEDPKLLHSFQINDMMKFLKYFSYNNTFGEYQWFSKPAMFFKESTPEQHPEHIVGEGLGIISRFPIIKTHSLKLSRDNDDGLDFHQRLLLGITVKINNDKLLDIYTTHLSLSEKARTRTLPEIGKYINDEISDSNDKIGAVLMGDFNCEFDYLDDEMDILSQDEYGFMDVWKSKGLCDDGDNGNNNNNNKRKKYCSYNYNNKWNQEIDSLFKSPNSDYFQRDEETISTVEFKYDFDAWWKNEDNRDGEWWRDNRCHKGFTFNTWDMKKRIDYFYVNKDLFDKISDIQVIGNDTFKVIPGLNPVGGVHDMFDKLYASDHRFLYLDIEINSS